MKLKKRTLFKLITLYDTNNSNAMGFCEDMYVRVNKAQYQRRK